MGRSLACHKYAITEPRKYERGELQPILNVLGVSDVFGSGRLEFVNSSRLWNVPTGVRAVRAHMIGGGGGAGGSLIWSTHNCGLQNPCQSNYAYCIFTGGSGGGAAYGQGVSFVTPGTQCCLIVGAGGAASTTNVCTCDSQPACTCGCVATGTDGGFTCALGFCVGGGYAGCGICWTKPIGCGQTYTCVCGSHGGAGGNTFSTGLNISACGDGLWAGRTYRMCSLYNSGLTVGSCKTGGCNLTCQVAGGAGNPWLICHNTPLVKALCDVMGVCCMGVKAASGVNYGAHYYDYANQLPEVCVGQGTTNCTLTKYQMFSNEYCIPLDRFPGENIYFTANCISPYYCYLDHPACASGTQCLYINHPLMGTRCLGENMCSLGQYYDAQWRLNADNNPCSSACFYYCSYCYGGYGGGGIAAMIFSVPNPEGSSGAVCYQVSQAGRNGLIILEY